MSSLVVRILLCDGLTDGEVCDAELTADDSVRSVTQLRTVAYRDNYWSTRGRDLCPDHNTRGGDSSVRGPRLACLPTKPGGAA